MTDTAVDAGTMVDQAIVERMSPAEMREICNKASERLTKVGSREAIALSFAYSLVLSPFIYLHPAPEARRRAEEAIEKAVYQVREWETHTRFVRRSERLAAILRAVEAGTYKAPRKRRKARKRTVAHG